MQVRVTVCGHTKSTNVVKPPKVIFGARQETYMLRQELDFELTGDEVRRPDETVHVEIWDTFLVKEFQVWLTFFFFGKS